MGLEEIEKLKERIARNPDSKLVVPLAEEYRKAEMFDQAIDVLKQCLEEQPSYMSARVALGKIYLEKGMPEEAQSEFEEVIKTIPDNLFAQKKLAEIYKELGQAGKAVQQYQMVLNINPLDEDAQRNIEQLSGSFSDEVDTHEDTSAVEKAELPDDISSADEEAEVEEEEAGEISQELPADEEDVISDEELVDAGASQGEADEPVLSEEFESFKDSIQSDVGPDDEVVENVDAAAGMFYSPDKSPEAEALETDDQVDEKKFAGNNVFDEKSVDNAKSGDIEAELAHAEELIGQSKFYDAIMHYNNLLTEYPDNNRILQRLHELRAYLKMIGKDKEEIINRLELLLGMIKQRKDGF
ncbi:tetratricopeptide repeat protein [bacterium BMS3Abin07]|nr:tetratricopeptide repeat protein [bacterium BMS3Abin07]GBE33458.1 tetratricopeptide repeat protein [bacterium BMS3Bbin05]HDO22740.1 tetratricopeptide repeat protein [Nitrospirota bacterium]HDZ88242.1 tetratricopeptide repeat protein [Nitrospirota bacterium]